MIKEFCFWEYTLKVVNDGTDAVHENALSLFWGYIGIGRIWIIKYINKVGRML